MSNWYRKPTKEICIGQEVYSTTIEAAAVVKNIRVDSTGSPIFTLQNIYFDDFVYARFGEIMEIY